MAIFKFIMRLIFTCLLITSSFSAYANDVERWLHNYDFDVYRKTSSTWCSTGGIHLEINSSSEGIFSSTAKKVERAELVSLIKDSLQQICPSATVIRISGFENSRYVFEGCMKGDNHWTLSQVAYANKIDKLLDPVDFDNNPNCKLPSNTPIFSRKYIQIIDHLSRFNSPECKDYLISKLGVSMNTAQKACALK